MTKDPAFLFYYQDFFTGVADLTNEEVGAYIRCLCIQASKGFITDKFMKTICISQNVYNSVKSKFVLDDNGFYFNPRLKLEAEKRAKHCESQRANANMRWHKIGNAMVMPLEDEDENEIKDVNINKELRIKAISILRFLNQKTGRSYRETDTNLDFIISRLKSNATVDDCRSVIAKKCREWKDNPKMNEYLRPATLFNKTKFEQYYGELIQEKPNDEQEMS